SRWCCVTSCAKHSFTPRLSMPQPLIVLDACEKAPLAHVLETTTRLCQSVWNPRLIARRQCLKRCNNAWRRRGACVLPCFRRTPLRHRASSSACCWRARCCALTNAKKASVSISENMDVSPFHIWIVPVWIAPGGRCLRLSHEEH